jgi:hypothetical protein
MKTPSLITFVCVSQNQGKYTDNKLNTKIPNQTAITTGSQSNDSRDQYRKVKWGGVAYG